MAEPNQSKPVLRRTPRNAAQWHAILTHHFATDETPQDVALSLKTASGVTATFSKLPTPAYLAEALRVLG